MKCRPKHGGVSFVSRVALIVLSVAIANSGCAGAPPELKRRVTTVAGKYGRIGDEDGPLGMSELSSPHAICKGRSSDEVLVGTIDRFRSFSRETRETSTIGKWEIVRVGDGMSRGAPIDKPRACVRRRMGSSTFVYFVEGLGELRYSNGNTVSSYRVVYNGSLTGVALYGNHLYMTEQNANTVWACEVGSDGVPVLCRSDVSLGGRCGNLGATGITVTRQGIFVVTIDSMNRGIICWFDTDGRKIAEVVGGYVDITSTDSGELFAAAQSELYRVTANDENLTTELFAGRSTSSCLPDTDGDDTLLCAVTRLLVVTEYEMYVTSARKHVLRAVTLPPVHVHAVFPGRPLPVGYPDKGIMEWVHGNLTRDVNVALNTTDTSVGLSSMHVDSLTWLTNFTAAVQQTDFDNETTEQALLQWEYNYTRQTVDEYYNLTDEQVYVDSTFVPYCNSTNLDALRRKLAEESGRVLNFTLIYADMPTAVGAGGAPNVTTIKLLMPASFSNTTTHGLLAGANLTDTAHAFIKYLRRSDTRADVVFPNPPFNFSTLSPDEEQEVRWYIHAKLMSELEMCEELSSRSTTTGVCQSTITNRTVSLVHQPPFDEKNVYELFVHGEYNFDVPLCIDGINWQDLNDYLNNSTNGTGMGGGSLCGNMCIIVLAVFCAFIVAFFIVLAVVFTSKRRRLAAVVAPSRPKFVSTLDEEELEYASTYGSKGGAERRDP